MKIRIVFTGLALACFSYKGIAQTDTLATPGYDNKAIKDEKPFWLGNTWYVSAGFHFSDSRVLDIGFGRSHAELFGMGAASISYGFNYGKQLKGPGGEAGSFKESHLAGAFLEQSIFIVLLGMTMRTEYMADITHNQHYIRPSIGLNFVFADVLYGYNFNLTGSKENQFRHMLTLRLKCFLPFKNIDTPPKHGAPAYR